MIENGFVQIPEDAPGSPNIFLGVRIAERLKGYRGKFASMRPGSLSD
jgi:hypothetical protein